MASVADRLTRKVGPLPVWGWAALILIAYVAYNHFKGSSKASGAPSTTDAQGTYVPPFDAASGGINGAYTPGTGNVYNYYYGDQNAGQAGGGGTGGSTPGSTPGSSGTIGNPNPFPPPVPPVGPTGGGGGGGHNAGPGAVPGG